MFENLNKAMNEKITESVLKGFGDKAADKLNFFMVSSKITKIELIINVDKSFDYKLHFENGEIVIDKKDNLHDFVKEMISDKKLMQLIKK
jgi:hypothetical protein